MRALYVRLPDDAAEKLHQAAFEMGLPKQDIVTSLLQDHLTVGKHEFFPNPVDEVLTPEEAAELLRSETATVIQMAEDGTLPARKVGDEWRFARSALMRWLGAEEEE
jgi:excisionase family DNA binding protein